MEKERSNKHYKSLSEEEVLKLIEKVRKLINFWIIMKLRKLFMLKIN